MIRQILSLVLLVGASSAARAESAQTGKYARPTLQAKAVALRRAKGRAPASLPSGMGLSFDAYLNANSRHPALNAQPGKIPGHQEAFKDFTKPAVITFPSDTMSPPGSTNAAAPNGTANLPGAVQSPSASGPASSSSSSSGSPLQ